MPNFVDLGLASPMGPQLRQLVEQQLLRDLRPYEIEPTGLKLDWSESCIEGHDAQYLDGCVENYSSISLYDAANKLVAEGWMEFIQAGPFFMAYWEFLDAYSSQEPGPLALKSRPGIPDHVWQQIPIESNSLYQKTA
jgi:hypothetical protein